MDIHLDSKYKFILLGKSGEKGLHSESLYKVSHIIHMAIISVFIRCSNKRLLYIHSESFIHYFTGLCGSNIRITSHLAY